MTGLSVQAAPLATQRIGLLREINPRLARVAVISSPTGEVDQERFARIQRTAGGAGVQTSLLAAGTVLDLEQAWDSMGPERPEGLLYLEGGGKSQIGSEILMFALQHRLATVGGSRSFVQGGGLLAYGPYLPHLYERVAAYVGKILNGTRPGDLPVEESARFELSVNTATAKTIGLRIPQKLLLAADQIVE